MVLEHFGLRDQPFGTTPDPRYSFESQTHREALASVLYAVETGRGFVALIGVPGMGKTTLLLQTLSHIRNNYTTVLPLQAIRTPLDLLRAVLVGLGAQDTQGGFFDLQTRISDLLRSQANDNKRVVIVLDEAQTLDRALLEYTRMLSNLGAAQGTPIQIILSGQPQLARHLSTPGLLQLRQRVSIIAQLQPLSRDEVAQYIEHRIRVAGRDAPGPLFTSAALDLIASHSQGIPRNINNLCFNALSVACALKQKTIDAGVVREVITDLDLDTLTALPHGSGTAPAPALEAKVATARRRVGIRAFETVAACLVMFALSGASIDDNPRAAVLASGARSEPSVLPPALSPQPQAQQAEAVKPSPTAETPGPLARPGRIVVQPGSSFFSICMATYGSCTARQMAELKLLNPRLRNPNHLRYGTVLRLPLHEEPAVSVMPAKQNAYNSGEEAARP